MKANQQRSFLKFPGTARIAAAAFLFYGAANVTAAVPDPLVKVEFDGTTDATVTNTGTLGGSGTMVVATDFPVLSTKVPTGSFTPAANTASIDFGAIATGQGGRAID